ncbi:MAG: CocE/NonD family hydrolase [Polyangiaceae bacterium]
MNCRYVRCLSVTGLFLLGCGSDPATGGGGEGGVGGGTQNGTGGAGGSGGAVEPAFQVRGSVEQVQVWRATPSAALELRASSGDVVASATTDDLGSFVFRKVPPAEGYSVVEVDSQATVSPVTVLSIPDSQPAASFYQGQTLVPGYGYITTRDGTKLAAYITLPGPPEDGPYPTVINYSGYDPAKPGAPIDGYEALCPTYPVLCDAPTDPSAFLGSLMGYATVSVNMRGTGCSGGAYDYFEDLQLLDGYDIVETVAAQDWVRGHKVGMVGLSYPGITQLFVAKTQPPSLAAITPLSVIGGTYSTGRPGGIFNDGFALAWISNVLDRAGPYGQGWEQGLVDAGDTICEENQLLHGQKVDVVSQAHDSAYYTDELVGRVDPSRFAGDIHVPVFLAGAWQDEQTGPFFFTLLDKLVNAPVKRLTTYNGVHVDGFSPQVLVEWKTFLDLYVADAIPGVSDSVRTIAPAVFQQIFQLDLSMPPDRLADQPSAAAARAVYEAEPPLRAIFEDGGQGDLGAPVGGFEEQFSSWPPPATATRFFFQPDGSLGPSAPATSNTAFSFDLDPDAGQRGILASGGNVWDPLPDYAWGAIPDGSAVVLLSEPLPSDAVMLGSGSVDLWVRAPVDDADLEVNLTEVRPDGQEMYVQSGWLRASLRALAPEATELWPEHTYRQSDEALLVPGEWTLVRVGIAGFSHVFRAGSRIRISVDTPGDSRAEWRFDLKQFPSAVAYDIGASVEHPSSIVLPVLTNVTSPTSLPPCPSLRGQQCRAFVPYTNVPAAP